MHVPEPIRLDVQHWRRLEARRLVGVLLASLGLFLVFMAALFLVTYAQTPGDLSAPFSGLAATVRAHSLLLALWFSGLGAVSIALALDVVGHQPKEHLLGRRWLKGVATYLQMAFGGLLLVVGVAGTLASALWWLVAVAGLATILTAGGMQKFIRGHTR
jgi:hypothetical protein